MVLSHFFIIQSTQGVCVEFKYLKELIAFIEKGSIGRIRVKEKDGFEFEVEGKDSSPSSAVGHPSFEIPKASSHSIPHHRGTFGEESGMGEEKKLPGTYITAPLVGTLYHAASPEDPPFVKIGDRVEEQTVVCIIEAMKVMNEVKAGLSGTVAEILVSNSHPVEFGTKLIRIV